MGPFDEFDAAVGVVDPGLIHHSFENRHTYWRNDIKWS